MLSRRYLINVPDGTFVDWPGPLVVLSSDAILMNIARLVPHPSTQPTRSTCQPPLAPMVVPASRGCGYGIRMHTSQAAYASMYRVHGFFTDVYARTWESIACLKSSATSTSAAATTISASSMIGMRPTVAESRGHRRRSRPLVGKRVLASRRRRGHGEPVSIRRTAGSRQRHCKEARHPLA